MLHDVTDRNAERDREIISLHDAQRADIARLPGVLREFSAMIGRVIAELKPGLNTDGYRLR
jgi:hypothetical protein